MGRYLTTLQMTVTEGPEDSARVRSLPVVGMRAASQPYGGQRQNEQSEEPRLATRAEDDCRYAERGEEHGCAAEFHTV